ncbi:MULTISPECIES: hypothetical protein [unclassified Bradyrhizobium]|uniref:hypothetical protein n=1 Tax=unclassified Bradyrhizobium TaxID=2631580 RepID=UPI002303C2F3|nr:hypothetical protein [Bradyrhizobium sp. CCBAU 45321]
MVSKSVLGEVGTAPRHVYFPHSASEGQTMEIAMLVRDSVVRAGAALADGAAA